MVLSEAMVLHSCPRAPSTCSHSSLAHGAPRWPLAAETLGRDPLSTRVVGSLLSPSRWGGGGGGGGEVGEAGTHPCNFPKENHPSLLPTPRAFPQMFLAGAHSSPSAGFRSGAHVPNPIQSVSSNRTLRQADSSASLFPPPRPSRGSRVHHAGRPAVPPSPVHSWGSVSRSAMSPSPARLREPRSCS